MTDHQKNVMNALRAMADAASFGAAESAQEKADKPAQEPAAERDFIRDLADELATDFHRALTGRLIMLKAEHPHLDFGDVLRLILGTAINFAEISMFQASAMMHINAGAGQSDLDDLRAHLLQDLDNSMKRAVRKGLDATGKRGDNGGIWL